MRSSSSYSPSATTPAMAEQSFCKYLKKKKNEKKEPKKGSGQRIVNFEECLLRDSLSRISSLVKIACDHLSTRAILSRSIISRCENKRRRREKRKTKERKKKKERKERKKKKRKKPEF